MLPLSDYNILEFDNASLARNSAITARQDLFINHALGSTTFRDTSTVDPAQIFFNDASSPGMATLLIDTLWENNFLPANGIVSGQARAILSYNAMLGFSGGGVTQMNLGSLEGSGTVAIGNSTLIVGGNDASTTGHLSTMDGDSGHFVAYGGWRGDVVNVKMGMDMDWGSVQVAQNVAALSQTETATRARKSRRALARWGAGSHGMTPWSDLMYPAPMSWHPAALSLKRAGSPVCRVVTRRKAEPMAHWEPARP
jgi:hypothetical protein